MWQHLNEKFKLKSVSYVVIAYRFVHTKGLYILKATRRGKRQLTFIFFIKLATGAYKEYISILSLAVPCRLPCEQALTLEHHIFKSILFVGYFSAKISLFLKGILPEQ